jgi:tRNA-dihydrouridine synthase
MIGRGALRNPWIFEQIDALLAGRTPPRPSGDDVLEHYDALAEMLRATYPKNTLGMLKEQVRYLARVVADGSAFMSAALRSSTADELRGVLAARLAGQPPDTIDLGARGGTLETSGSAVAS